MEFHTFFHLLVNLKEACLSFAESIANSNDLKVWQVSDRQGNTYWRTYDPGTGCSGSFGSEEEVISWIEQRYYRS